MSSASPIEARHPRYSGYSGEVPSPFQFRHEVPDSTEFFDMEAE
jgi:hypothetical protein